MDEDHMKMFIKDVHCGEILHLDNEGKESLAVKIGQPAVEVEKVNVSGVVIKRTSTEQLTSFVIGKSLARGVLFVVAYAFVNWRGVLLYIDDSTDQIEVVVADKFKPMTLKNGTVVEVLGKIKGEDENGKTVIKACG